MSKYGKQSAHCHYERITILSGVVICFAALLILRLGFLQVSEYQRYQTLSFNNQIGIIPLNPPRGLILDRNGIVLAENTPVYVLEIIPEHVKDMVYTLQELQRILPSITDDDIASFKKSIKQHRSFVPIPLKLELSQEEVAIFASLQYQFRGVSIKAHLMRHYPHGELLAHVLGYVGRINLEELKTLNAVNYRATSFIGKAGIEKYYEDRLHGETGYQYVETDASGRTIRVLGTHPPISGDRLYLTIDFKLQEAAQKALSESRGALVAIDPRNGDILALASSPSFDPNLFVHGIPQSIYETLMNAKERPLYNRAVRGLYPPASTIKPFIALAGLNQGITDTSFRVFDPGWFKLPNSTHAYRDWKKTGHGVINITRAITVSCDTYFYQLGHRMGIGNIERFLKMFGFGELTKVDLYEESRGILPSAEWKKTTKKVPWYPGDTLITSIGQGFMLASPLQLASAVATLSLKGERVRPHLLHRSITADQGPPISFVPQKEEPVVLQDSQYWTIVANAMREVITSQEGTGYRFGRNAPYPVAAKTGTAQVFGGKHYEKKRGQIIPPHLRDHSLFIAFAPFDAPEIAIAVMVENDTLASEVARKVMDTWHQNSEAK